MESEMNQKMKHAWLLWHGDMEEDDIPSVNASFKEGFEACHDILMPLLIESALHVMASHGAEHMLDGFRPQRRPIDDLVDKIKEVLPK